MGPSEVPRCIGLATRTRARYLNRVLLGHARDHREHALVQRTTRGRWRICGRPGAGLPLPGMVQHAAGRCRGRRPWLARAIMEARRTGQLRQLSESLSMAATAENMAGDHGAARLFLDETEALTPGLDSYPATIHLIQAKAIHAFFDGDLRTAGESSAEGARLCREEGDLYYLVQMLIYLGQVAMLNGDVTASKPRFIDALRIARQIDDRLAQYDLLSLLGWHAASSGDPHLAAQLLGAAEAVGTSAGAGMTGPAMPLLIMLRPEVSASACCDSPSAILSAASQHADAETSDHAETGPLANREVEVARLIADGLSNKQIGSRLFISDRTVATHVRNILNKLGFDSRAQIASWMASSRL